MVPENDWGTCGDVHAMEAEGWGVGERPDDFRMSDQHADDTTLYQFQGCVTLVDISTLWCAPCQALAVYVQDTADDYRDQVPVRHRAARGRGA